MVDWGKLHAQWASDLGFKETGNSADKKEKVLQEGYAGAKNKTNKKICESSFNPIRLL